MALLCWWRSTSTFNCFFFKFFLFLLLFVHNDVICNIVNIESSISCPCLSNWLSSKGIHLRLKESSLVGFLWRLISHFLIAFNWVEALILRRRKLIKWLLVFLIIIHSLFLLLHHLFNLSFLVYKMLFFSFGSLGIFLHLVMNF